MAVLQKLRTKFGLAISIIVGLGLLSFIIDPGQIQSAVQSMSSKFDVGKINGKSISYTDFQGDVDKFTTLSELMTGSSVRSEQQQNQIRNSAWQSLIDKYLFVKKAKAAGINVGEEEMTDLFTSDNAPAIIAQNNVFVDENGIFSKDKVVEFAQSKDADQSGQLQLYWNYLQNTVYNQQFYTKYGALFTASNFQNALMQRKSIEENNTTSAVDFVMVPFGYAADTTIVVSDSEIKAYYDAHKKLFRQRANRDIEYVVFEVVPSATDIQAASEKIAEAYEEFATVDNMKAFLLKNSDRALSSYWYRAGELASVNTQISDFVDANGVGAVSPIIKSGNTFYAVKVMDQAVKSDNITVRLTPAYNETEISDELLAALRMSEAMTLSQSAMIPGCEVLFDAALNTPQIVKTSQYGNLAAEVIEKEAPVLKKQVAILEKTAVASDETFNVEYAKANKFATIANGSYKNYRAAVDTMGVYSHPMNNVLESTSSYGAVDNAKEVTRWIFDAKKGKVSEIITVNQKYFIIAALKNIHKEGIAPVEEVSSGIKSMLAMEKQGEKKAEEIAGKIAGMTDMNAIAEALGSSVSSQDIAFTSMGNRGLDPKFVGAVAAAKEGQISGPVAGSIGVYVFKVNSRDAGSFYTEEDAATDKAREDQFNSQMIIPVMMEAAGVVDNRARFF